MKLLLKGGRLIDPAAGVDELLGGGVETMAITEMYGKFSSGKSQLGFQLVVNVQRPTNQGGLGGGVLFVDSEATFRPDRIVQMAEAQGMDPQEVLKNIQVARAENSDHQIILLERAEETISSSDIDVNAMMRGKFTLRDMYKQLESLNKMGPLKQIMSMLPLGNMKVPEGVYDVTSTKMNRYRIIMDSMTGAELDDPTLISSSRIQRVAHGAGASPEEVRELIKYYKTMKRALKGVRGGGGKFDMQRMMKRFSG